MTPIGNMLTYTNKYQFHYLSFISTKYSGHAPIRHSVLVTLIIYILLYILNEMKTEIGDGTT